MIFSLASTFIFVESLTNYSTQNADFEGEDKRNADKDSELSDAELSKIVAEIPLDDPLNAFYDPYEPYRLSSFAYWHPITYPELHQNGPVPTGFIPPNAPPKSLPSDFFLHDDEARKLVLSEHAAAFCPYLRRWREKHPLKPYPVGPDFLQRHSPIKFVPGKGYEIDAELDQIMRLSQTIEEGVINRHVAKMSHKPAAEVDNVNKAGADANVTGPEAAEPEQQFIEEEEEVEGHKKRANVKNPFFELELLLKMIEEVKKVRPDCRKHTSFIDPIPTRNVYYTGLPSCLHEAIFRMEEMEDIIVPADEDNHSPEIANKPEYFRQVLLRLNTGKGFQKGKCPFGFGGSKKNEQMPPLQVPNVYQGTIPEWAQLQPGEEIFSSGEDSEMEAAEKYLFSYKQVPFPSIQDTLKKYVSL